MLKRWSHSTPHRQWATWRWARQNEGLGNYPEAIAAYQKASTLAQAQNKPEIDVLARMQLATLMQRPSVPTSSVP